MATKVSDTAPSDDNPLSRPNLLARIQSVQLLLGSEPLSDAEPALTAWLVKQVPAIARVFTDDSAAIKELNQCGDILGFELTETDSWIRGANNIYDLYSYCDICGTDFSIYDHSYWGTINSDGSGLCRSCAHLLAAAVADGILVVENFPPAEQQPLASAVGGYTISDADRATIRRFRHRVANTCGWYAAALADCPNQTT